MIARDGEVAAAIVQLDAPLGGFATTRWQGTKADDMDTPPRGGDLRVTIEPIHDLLGLKCHLAGLWITTAIQVHTHEPVPEHEANAVVAG